MARLSLSRRQFLKVTTAALSSAVLAACGATPTPTPAPTPKPAATAVPTPKPTAVPVTIKASVWDYDLYAYDKAMIENFMSKNPNIKVEPLNFPNSDYDTKVNVMLSGGEDLDVIYAKSVALFGGLIGKNQVMDVKPLITRDNLDLKPYGASITAYMTLNNAVLGLPYRYDRYLLYYNKDIFDAAKEPYPSPDLTWDDYRALAMKLTKGTGNSKTYGGFFAPFNYCFVTPGLQEGKGGYDTMDFNLFRDGWSNFYTMMYTDKSAPDWPSMKSVSADQTYFLKGTTGMMTNGTWFLNLAKTEIDAGHTTIHWGAQRVPVSKAMKTAGVHASNASITPICINAKSKNADAAWALVKYICSEEAGKIAASYLITPGYNSAGVVDAMAQVKGFDPTAKDALLNSGAAYPMGSGCNKFLGGISTMVNQQMELLFTQNQDMDKTFSEMDKQRKTILAG
jgi:multiple sugar transport system substrate-binding protein